MRQRFKTLRRLACGLAAVGMISLGATMVSAPASSASVTKTVITFAEAPGAAPNYIFPFMTLAYFSVANISQFEYYMYRPLYWVGTGSKPIVNNTLSVGEAPVFTNSDKTVKITVKSYKWSNGEKLTATDVLFFLNLWQAAKTKYAAWAPGGFSIPTIVKSVKVTSSTTLTITLKRSLNPHWFEYNELAAVTPFPIAWTRTSLTAKAGSAGCATAKFGTASAACHAVYVFLSEQSGHNPTKPTTKINALPTYATNPLWKVVDGPWKLTSFGPTAPAVMVPNPSYSGPNKPTYKEFIEKPFTTATAIFSALVGGTVDLGALPFTDVTTPATPPSKPSQTTKPGKNNPRLKTNYNLVPSYRWGINYFPENFNSVGDTGNAGAIFKQLYVRQALQLLVDQELYIERILRGYGVPTYGPVPVWPHNPYSSSYEEKNPYSYNPGKAKSLLADHGWKVVATGVSTCKKPGTGAGECGKGIPKGAKLDFTLQYISGTKAETALMDAEKSSWAKVGLRVNLSSADFDAVISAAVPCHGSSCKWTMQNWGGGWIFAPDYYPTGEEIFATGAGSNAGDFTTATNNTLIKQTDTTSVGLTSYENWLTAKLPVVWQPEIVTINEIHDTITHPPLNPLDANTPATFHWK